mgnify:CR=1 FL=1
MQTFPDGSRYAGDWDHDVRHGTGEWFDASIGLTYSGAWAEDQPTRMLVVCFPVLVWLMNGDRVYCEIGTD